MSKPEWGTKRTCQSCAAHFYDMRKDTIVCPKCGATYDPEAVLKSRRGRVVEKLARDVKMLDIGEGTGQIQRLIIARALVGLPA